MDRIDIHIEVPALKFSELSSLASDSETSSSIRNRVIKAREIQSLRFANTRIHCNAQMQSKEVKKYCILYDKAYEILKSAIDKLNFSARSYDKILKVSRTIADLDAIESIKANHVAEAIRYRFIDRC